MQLSPIIRTIAIFGSAGSIGKNTVKIIKENRHFFDVKLLATNSNVEELAKQAIDLSPEYVVIEDHTKFTQLEDLLKNTAVKILKTTISEAAKIKVDMALMAIMGHYALEPTINLIKSGSNIALANKECLVCAGNIINNLAKKHNVKIIPVDSEHSGLFQIFDFERHHLIKAVTLTASGGPFREYSLQQMQNVTKAQALKHPNWSMGAKITVDSATLVNKSLEVIEAYHLFPIDANQIKIVIHPESIIHAMLQFRDGSMLMQASMPNMQIPISYALFYPERANLNEFNQFDLATIGRLNFEKPDPVRFRSLKLLESILQTIDSNSSLVFNIANEVAVEAFLKDKIKFIQIVEVIEYILNKTDFKKLNELEQVFETIHLIKKQTENYIKTISY